MVVTYCTCSCPGFAACPWPVGFSSMSRHKGPCPRDTTDPLGLSQPLPMTCPNHKLPCSIPDSMECLLLLVPQVCPLNRGGPAATHPPHPHSSLPMPAASWSSRHMWDSFHTLQFLSSKFKSQSHNHLCFYVCLGLTHANSVKWHQQKVITFLPPRSAPLFKQHSLFLLTVCTILPS